MASQHSSSSSVAGRYAAALFELADSEGALERVERDLGLISRMIEASADLQRLVRSPAFSADEQSKALAALLARAGISGLTANFAGVVIRNRRLFALQDMIQAFGALLADRRGEITADVVSARPLDEAQVASLKTTLNSSTGRDVRIDMRVDPTLLGGLTVQVGSRMIDSSIRTKLNSLKLAMREAG